jgi:hypothetical protein
MTELEVRKLVGNETLLQFDCLVDNIADFKTVRPMLVDGDYKHYKVSVFYEDCNVLHNYDSLDGFLRTMQIFEVTEISDTQSDHKNIYHNKYQEKLIIK